MDNSSKYTAPEDSLPDLSTEKPETIEAMPKRSRLQSTLENNSKKTILLTLLGIAIILTLLAVFGIPALVKFAEVTGKREEKVSSQEEEAILIIPPYLNENRQATNSAEVTIMGSAEDGDSVKLYKEGRLVKETKITADNSFAFKGVELKEGKNTFKAKAFKDTNESRFSDPITITYSKDAPKLSIDYPSEGQSIGNKDGDRLQIEGTTDPDITITVNGSMAIVDDEGKFKHVIPIKGGENSIKAVATDEAGNKTELERKFTYNP